MEFLPLPKSRTRSCLENKTNGAYMAQKSRTPASTLPSQAGVFDALPKQPVESLFRSLEVRPFVSCPEQVATG